jgi:tetratricopeptide (TPR) repeat protein
MAAFVDSNLNVALNVGILTAMTAAFIVAVVDGQLNWIVRANLSGRKPRAAASIFLIFLAYLLFRVNDWTPWPREDFTKVYSEATTALKSGELEKAIDRFSRALDLAQQPSDRGDAHRGLADAYRQKGQQYRTSAVEQYKMAAAEHDTTADCSKCSEERSDLESATDLSSRYPDPELAEAWRRLAKHDQTTGRLDEGETAWEEVVDLSPDPSTAWAGLEEQQKSYSSSGEHIARSVVACLHRNQPALQAEPGQVGHMAYNRAQGFDPELHNGAGNLPEAICAYERAREVLTQEGDTSGWVFFYYKDFGRALVHAGYYTLALKQLERAQRVHRDDFWVLGAMGDAYARLGKNPQACEYYGKAMSAATPQDDPGGNLKRSAATAGCKI